MKTSFPRPFVFAVVSLALCGLPNVSRADYSIIWSTIAGGGDTSTGGAYSLTGTIGQSDTGAMSGPNYAIAGGFWSMPEGPILSIHRNSPTDLMISWPSYWGGYQLQQTPALGQPQWTDVSSAPVVVVLQSQASVSPTIGNQFYRLKKH